MDWEIIKVADEDGLSQDDKNCLARLNSMKVYKERKYEFLMLWQDKNRSFPNNYNVGLKQFSVLKQQLKRDPDLRNKYKNIINTFSEKSYAKAFSRE